MGQSILASKLLPVTLLAAAGAVFYVALAGDNDEASKEKQRLEHVEKVETNLKYTDKESKQHSQKIYYDNIRSAPSLNESHPTQTVDVSGPTIMESDVNDEVVAERLSRKSQYAPAHNYEQQLQDKISIQEQNKEYNEAYQKEYARQFVENAEKGGYAVKLSDDYKVIGVKKIRKPNSVSPKINNNGAGVE